MENPGGVSDAQKLGEATADALVDASTGGTWRQVATGLGWFSIGLGAAELIAPKQMARLIGARHRPTLMRGFGAREIASGVGILTQRPKGAWLWSRVAGDALDLSMLTAALVSGRNRGRTAAAVAAVAGVTALDVLCSRQFS